MFDFDDLEDKIDEEGPGPDNKPNTHDASDGKKQVQNSSSDGKDSQNGSSLEALQCGLCGDSDDVTHFCVDCDDHLCKPCLKMHTEVKTFKDHTWRPHGVTSNGGDKDGSYLGSTPDFSADSSKPKGINIYNMDVREVSRNKSESDKNSMKVQEVSQNKAESDNINIEVQEVLQNKSESDTNSNSGVPVNGEARYVHQREVIGPRPIPTPVALPVQTGPNQWQTRSSSGGYPSQGSIRSNNVTSAPQPTISSGFSCGDQAVIDCLVKRADLNGSWAAIQSSVQPSTGRIEMIASNGETVRVKPENLTKVDLYQGTPVRVVALSSRPELNGLVGILNDFDAAKGRWNVEMSDKSILKLQPKCCVRVKLNAKAVVIQGAESGAAWTPDIFGTKRGRCNKCGIKCPQYQARPMRINGCGTPQGAEKGLNCLRCGCGNLEHADLGKVPEERL